MARKDKGFKTSVAADFISSAAEPQQPAEGFTIPEGYMLKKESKTARLQLLIRPTTKTRMRKLAAAEGISLNELVNQILDEYVDERRGN